MSVSVFVGCFYHFQLDLMHVVTGCSAYLSKGFRQDVLHWRRFFRDVLNRTTFLEEVVQCLPTELGLCYDSGLVAGGVWNDTNRYGSRYLLHLACPKDVVEDLVRWSNPLGGTINPDFEILALVLQESFFPNV